MKTLAAAVTALWFLGLSVGCARPEQLICEEACDCEGCDNQDFDDCVDELDELKADATDEACEPEYRAVLHCLDDDMECDDDDVSLDECEDEVEDLADCLDEPVLGFGVVVVVEDEPEDAVEAEDDDPCEEIHDCCLALEEEANATLDDCDSYDTATDDECEAAIDAYLDDPSETQPAACDFH